MVERKRCPNCGAINYGDVNKCWKCGADLKQPAGTQQQPIPSPPKPTLEETVPQKAPRIKNPMFYPLGTVVIVVGVILAVVLVTLPENPGDLRKKYDSEHAVFDVSQDFPVTVTGEVTAISSERDEYGYYLYELDGDGVIEEKVVSGSIHPDKDLIVRSKSQYDAKVGDTVVWEVKKESNDVGQDYLVKGKTKSFALYWSPGVALVIVGLIIIIIGYVGLPDRSMKKLLEATEAPLSSPAITVPPVVGPASAPTPVQPTTPVAVPPQAPPPVEGPTPPQAPQPGGLQPAAQYYEQPAAQYYEQPATEYYETPETQAVPEAQEAPQEEVEPSESHAMWGEEVTPPAEGEAPVEGAEGAGEDNTL